MLGILIRIILMKWIILMSTHKTGFDILLVELTCMLLSLISSSVIGKSTTMMCLDTYKSRYYYFSTSFLLLFFLTWLSNSIGLKKSGRSRLTLSVLLILVGVSFSFKVYSFSVGKKKKKTETHFWPRISSVHINKHLEGKHNFNLLWKQSLNVNVKYKHLWQMDWKEITGCRQ